MGEIGTGTAPPVMPPQLNAGAASGHAQIMPSKINAIERQRAEIGLTQVELCWNARISRQTYERLLAGRGPFRRSTLMRLRRALARGRAGLALADDLVTRCLYNATLAAVCGHFGYDFTLIKAQRPWPVQSSMPEWLRAADARRIAIYLVNTGAGVRQMELARVCAMTPAAISIACGQVEDAREDAQVDAIIAELETQLMGDRP
jgi:hypothetical protein